MLVDSQYIEANCATVVVWLVHDLYQLVKNSTRYLVAQHQAL